ncbi:MAG: hypothetical protein ACI4MC_03615 [Candidatus Coproplasma sp.]
MKKFKFKSLVIALAAVIVAVPTVSVPAFANSGPPWEEGITSTGIHCVHESSVLQVQSETLTFNIGTPLYELQEGEKFNSTVTAEYTFYNPTADTVNTQMAFPIGLVPYYAQDNAKIDKIENPITVDGQPVEYSVRHTYGTYNSFEEDVKKIKDGYYETDFFKVDLLVTEYVFKANLLNDLGSATFKDSATFKVKMPQSTGTRFFGNTDGNSNFNYYLYNGEKFSIFVLGNDLDISNLNWSITRYSSLYGREIEVNGSVTLEKKMESTTFKNYVLQGYDSKSEVSEVDFYNAMFDLIYTDGVWAGYGTTPSGNNFTEWYVYETSVEGGGTFKNAVTATLYPTVYHNFSPYIYEYNYYLSPAKEWASFGNLTVNINTSQYMQKCDYYDPADTENSIFQKTETGYSATFTSLPTTELSFKTCSVETPALPEYSNGITSGIVAGIILGVFFILAPLAVGLTFLIIFLVRRRRNKKLAGQQAEAQPVWQSPDQASAAEMSIDSEVDDGIVASYNDGEKQSQDEESGENNGEKRFCIYCGSRLDKGVKFCPDCGGAVESESTVQPVRSAYGSPVHNGGKRVNGFGIAGFVLSLIALLTLSSPVCILFVGAAFGLSLTGVILRKKYQGVYGLAIAGLIISAVLIALIVIGVFLAIIGLFCWGGVC